MTEKGFRKFEVTDRAVEMGKKLGLQGSIDRIIADLARAHVPTCFGPRIKRCGIFAIEVIDGKVTRFGLGPQAWQEGKSVLVVRRGSPEFVE